MPLPTGVAILEKEPQEEPAESRSWRGRSWSKRSVQSLHAEERLPEVPQVPPFCAPPPPAAASHTSRAPPTPTAPSRTSWAPPTPTAASRAVDGGTLAEVRAAIEALGETVCHRVEQMLERMLERAIGAAFERSCGSTSGLESLSRAKGSTDETKCSTRKHGDGAECHCSKSDRKEDEGSTGIPVTVQPASQDGYASSESSPDDSQPREVESNAKEEALKRLRFDEDIVPLASLEVDRRPFAGSLPQFNADLWPSWAGKGDPLKLRDVPLRDVPIPIDTFDASERSIKSSRLKVDIRVSFKEIEARGLDTNGNLRDLDNRIMRMAKMPSTVTNKEFPVLQRLVMHPASNPILVWHIIGPFLLLYDVIMIPMQAFPLPQLVAFAVIAVISTTYWSLDTVRCFFTGFETEKSVEMRPGVIAMKYIRSWFILDATACSMDWALIIMGSVGSFNKFWRTGRAVHAWRLLRLVRLVRVLKLARRFGSFAADRITSLQGLIALKSVYIGVGVCFACHYMACYWYLVGDVNYVEPLEQETTWLKAYGLANSTLVEVYVSSFHWAMGQSGFTPAEIYPTNTVEKIYASYVSFCWLIIVSVTINLFSIWLGHLHEANKDREMQNIYLRKFLDEHDVSRKLTSRVLRCFRANYSAHQRRVHEEDVSFLRDLPVSLKICLRREVFIPVLRKHPFFAFIGKVNPILPIMITYCAMFEDRYLAGEIVFAENTPAKHMFYVLIGQLNYYAVQTEVSSTMGVTKLRPGDWALEPALWLRWTCQGRLVAEITSELVNVDVEKFMAIMHHVRAKGEDIEGIKLYAKQVCNHFLNYNPSADLWWDKREMDELANDLLDAQPSLVKKPQEEDEGSPVAGSWSLGPQ